MYLRACCAFPELVGKMKFHLRAEVVQQWDLYACLRTQQGVHWCALIPEGAPAVSDVPPCVGPEDQMTTFTWFGFVKCRFSHAKHPQFVARKYLAQWTLAVVQGICRPKHNGPSELPVVPVPSAAGGPYDMSRTTFDRPWERLWGVLAWVLRWDPRLRLQQRYGVQVGLPPFSTEQPGEFHYVLVACGPGRCFMVDCDPRARQVVLCGCMTGAPNRWHVVQTGIGWVLAGGHSYTMAPLAML